MQIPFATQTILIAWLTEQIHTLSSYYPMHAACTEIDGMITIRQQTNYPLDSIHLFDLTSLDIQYGLKQAKWDRIIYKLYTFLQENPSCQLATLITTNPLAQSSSPSPTPSSPPSLPPPSSSPTEPSSS